MEASDSGFKKLIRRVMPSLGNGPANPSQSVSVASEERE